jgi:hypothetical protein
MVSLGTGILVVDDSTLDKLFAEKMELVTRQESGKPGRVGQGIKLISLNFTIVDRRRSLHSIGLPNGYIPSLRANR